MFLNLRRMAPHKDKNLIISGELSFLKSHGPEVVLRNSVFEKWRNEPGFLIFVAEINNEPSAYVWFGYNESLDAVDVNTVYVTPQHRNKKIMQRLLKYAMEYVSSEYDFTYFAATTLTTNKASISLFQKFGFSLTDEKDSLFNNRGGFQFLKNNK